MRQSSLKLPRAMQLLIVAMLAVAIVVVFGLQSITSWLAGKPKAEAGEAQASQSPNSLGGKLAKQALQTGGSAGFSRTRVIS